MVPKRIGRCYELAGKVMTGEETRGQSVHARTCFARHELCLGFVECCGVAIGCAGRGTCRRCRTATRKSACVPSRPRCSFMRSIARSTGGAGGNRRGGRRGRSRCMVDFARHRSRRDSPPNGLPRRCARSSASSIDDVAFRSPNANPAEEGTRPRQDLDPLETCSWRGVTAISWRGVTAILSFGLGRATKIKIE